jgi:hypothetical protein
MRLSQAVVLQPRTWSSLLAAAAAGAAAATTVDARSERALHGVELVPSALELGDAALELGQAQHRAHGLGELADLGGLAGVLDEPLGGVGG